MKELLQNLRNEKTSNFAFKAPASYANILTAGSVEAVNTANNHSHDYGEESFNDTLKALDTANILHFGYDETAVTEVKGVKVGLVGIYELNDHLGREEQLKQNIAKVKQDGAQLIVVIFHWGNEKEEVPDENQKTLGHLAIDEGAILSAAIIHMFCRESKNIKVRISYTALEISALVEMHIQVIWTL